MQESRQTLVAFEEDWDAGETATYAIRPRGAPCAPDRASGDSAPRPREGEDGAGELAGTCGLTCHWDQDCATLGLWLRKRFWGRGYSGERADALLELAFEHLDFGVVAVTHHVGNENSERAISKYVERNGGRREGVLRHHGEHPGGAVDEVRYTIARDEWRAARE